MKMLVINKFGQNTLFHEVDFIPRIGDKIDVYYEPLPTVTMVVAMPSDKRIEAIDSSIKDVIDAIVIAE